MSKAMERTLFEKLIIADVSMTLRQSVIDNIDRILGSDGFLDSENLASELNSRLNIENNFHYGIRSITEQSAVDSEQLQSYKESLVKILLRFEPRLVNVEVKEIFIKGIHSTCNLKIRLIDGEFDQVFVFS